MICNAALACFAKHGYEKASIHDIAAVAGVMKVENLKKHPYVVAFITGAATEGAADLKDILPPVIEEGKRYTRALVLREEDRAKFKRPEDAKSVFQMLMLLGEGLAVRLEAGSDYDSMMAELKSILRTLKYNFYKEEYLP